MDHLASAMKSNNYDSNVPVEADDDEDDFEVVSPPPEPSDSYMSTAIAPEREDATHNEQVIEGQETVVKTLGTGAENSTIHGTSLFLKN
jgi:hypothetical protein